MSHEIDRIRSGLDRPAGRRRRVARRSGGPLLGLRGRWRAFRCPDGGGRGPERSRPGQARAGPRAGVDPSWRGGRDPGDPAGPADPERPRPGAPGRDGRGDRVDLRVDRYELCRGPDGVEHARGCRAVGARGDRGAHACGAEARSGERDAARATAGDDSRGGRASSSAPGRGRELREDRGRVVDARAPVVGKRGAPSVPSE